METARGAVDVREPTKLEQTSARRVAESKATIPHLYLDAELEVAPVVDAAGLTARVVNAVAAALRKHPALNGSYRDGRFETYSRVNVGVAIPGDGPPVVPTVFDADAMQIDEIASRLSELEEALDSGALTSPQLAGGTFTVTVLASPAVRRMTPVINAGQAAILAVGGIHDAPVLSRGQVRPGRVIVLTLACDHRMVSASEGAAFLDAVKAALSDTR